MRREPVSFLEFVLCGRESAGYDVLVVFAHRGADNLTQICVLLDEAWGAAPAKAKHVLPDQDLSGGGVAGADANGRDLQRGIDFGGDRAWHHVHQDAEGAGILQCDSVVLHLCDGVAAALHAVPA